MKRLVSVLLVIILAGSLVIAGCQELESPIEDYDWVLTTYGRFGPTEPVLPDTEITVRFDSAEKQVSGNAGCNSYFGSYEVDGLELTIPGPMAVTEMWCGEEIGEQEQEYLE